MLTRPDELGLPGCPPLRSWYDDNAFLVWGSSGPTWEETKKHSKGMRRLEDIPDYFRKYRKCRKKKRLAGALTLNAGGEMEEGGQVSPVLERDRGLVRQEAVGARPTRPCVA